MKPPGERPPLDPPVLAYISDSYPHNLDYSITRGVLKPRWKLRSRLKRLQALYANPLGDLLDLSSSKGFFVLDAATHPECKRALGIDVHAPDIEASRAVALHLGLIKARFELTTLRELSATIEARGGAFDTVLLVNTYPYLFFGSDRSEATAEDHDEIFRLLATVCAGRLVFSNRVDFAALPRHIQKRARESRLEENYDEAIISAAAQKHFVLEKLKPLKKIPLWLLTPIDHSA
ncbi:MAG: hypothetical protein ACI8X5_003395 [Planctomycetota bacterium]